MESKGNWCCVAFEGAFESAGERAFAIIVDRRLDEYSFVLQHRALEPGDPGRRIIRDPSQ
jgi:hypothetical protein